MSLEKRIGDLLERDGDRPAGSARSGSSATARPGAALEARARRLGLTGLVEFRPFVADRRALARLYREAACVVAPGPHETFGLAVLEAAASGARVVACSCTPAAALAGPLVHTFSAEGPAGSGARGRARAGHCRRRRRRGHARRIDELGAGLPRPSCETAAALPVSGAIDRAARGEAAGRGASRARRQLARGEPGRRHSLRLHLPGAAALPPPVVLGLVLSRDRVAPLRARRARARSCARWCAAAGSTASSRTRSSGTTAPAGGGPRSTPPTRCAVTAQPRTSRRRCSRSPGRWSPPPRRTIPDFAAEALDALRLHYDWLEPPPRSRRRRADLDHPPRRVGARRLAQVRPGVRLDEPLPAGLLLAGRALTAAPLRLAGDHRALRRARRGRARQRVLRAVAAVAGPAHRR